MSRPYVKRASLVVVLVALFPPRSTLDLHMSSLSAAVQDLASTALGVERMQEHYNSLMYIVEDRDAATIADSLAGQLEEDFKAQGDALLALKQRVELLYSDGDTAPIKTSSQCCNLRKEDLTQDFNFPVNVSMTMSCDRVSRRTGSCVLQESTINGKLGLMDVYTNNFQSPLKWQYFASEAGVSNFYPAYKVDNCASYDARFRPWYTASATPNFKDVVVVVKNNKFTTPGDYNTLIQAANILINTLNPRDRLAVLMYNSDVHRPALSGCYASSLSTASPANIVKFQNFLLTAPDPRDGDNLLSALKASFDYFSNDEMKLNQTRNRAVAVFTDGETMDSKDAADNITALVARYNASDIFLFFFVSVPAKSYIPTTVRSFYDSLLPPATALQRHYIELTSGGGDIRNMMQPFYSTFSTSQGDIFKPVYIPPYYKSGLDQLVSSLCTPCFKRSNGQLTLVGVAGVDLSLTEVLEGIEYFQRDSMTYAFIIDQQGLVIVHPLLPTPTYTLSSVYLHIEALERADNISKVIDSMIRGEVGCSLLSSVRTLPQGSRTYGGAQVTTLSQYCWQPIGGTPFFLCVVNPVNIDFRDINATSFSLPIDAQYHRLDLLSTDSGTMCSHFNSKVNEAFSTVHLSPEAFGKPNEYVLSVETVQTAKYIQTSLQKMSDPKQQLQREILETVAATAKVTSLWASNQSSPYTDYIVWRYIATPTGVMRIYPGVQLASKDMAIIGRPWYKRAVANLGNLALSTPNPDVLGTRNVITFSQTVVSKSCNEGSQDYNCSVLAVMGMDITYPSFIHMLYNNTPLCQDSSYRCMVIDREGYLIAHDSFDGFGDEQYVHITEREPLLSQDMYRSGYLNKTYCYSFQYDDNFTKRPRRRNSYEITSVVAASLRPLQGGYSTYCVFYSIAPISSTNAYLIVVDQKKTDLSLCSSSISCSCNVDWPCSSIPHDCTCPCYNDIPPDNYNPCLETFQNLEAYACPAATTLSDTVPVMSSLSIIPSLPSCSALPCVVYGSDFSNCTYFSDCQLCAVPTSSGTLEQRCMSTCPAVTTSTAPPTVTTTTPSHSSSSSYNTTAMVLINASVTEEVVGHYSAAVNHTSSSLHLSKFNMLETWQGVAIGCVVLVVVAAVSMVIARVVWRQRNLLLKVTAAKTTPPKGCAHEFKDNVLVMPAVTTGVMLQSQRSAASSHSTHEDSLCDVGGTSTNPSCGGQEHGDNISVGVESRHTQLRHGDVREGSIDPSHVGGIWF